MLCKKLMQKNTASAAQPAAAQEWEPKRTAELQMQLADLKRIQKAKSLLQRQLGMSEQDAHRWIEKAAMDRCVKKREIAETVIRLYDT